MRIWKIGVFALVVTFGVIYVGAGSLADYFAERLPDDTERSMFGDLGSREKGWSDTGKDDAAHKRAKSIFAKLIKIRGLRALDYQLYFAEEEAPNAFALPGGAVGVTEGMLTLVDSEIGLATVLGHELGHQQYRHSLKLMGRGFIFGFCAHVMTGGDNSFIANAAMDVTLKSHSRGQELDADAYGLKLVNKAYGTTEGALEFFEKIEHDPKSRDNKLLSMFSTHPYTPDRIQKLRHLQKELGKKKTLQAH